MAAPTGNLGAAPHPTPAEPAGDGMPVRPERIATMYEEVPPDFFRIEVPLPNSWKWSGVL